MKNLSEITSLRLGGPPDRLIEATDEVAATEATTDADRSGTPLLVLGGGSNLVVADRGFPGTALRLRMAGIERREDPAGAVLVTARAGEVWDDLVATCIADRLSGIECLSGIPGSVGATPVQNVGAYGQEVADTIVSVRAFDRLSRETADLAPAACGFGYRTSYFKRTPDRWLILAVTYRLRRSSLSAPIRYAELATALGIEVGQRAPLDRVREAVLSLRRGKGLLAEPGDPESATAGSFFTNPVLTAAAAGELTERVVDLLGPEARPPLFEQPDGTIKSSAAWLIQQAGFEPGYGDPQGIAISSRHCLVLTNRGRGTTTALLSLAHEIADTVEARFGVALRPEPTLVGTSWN